MDFEEFMEVVESLRKQGLTDEDLLNMLLNMFKQGKIDMEDMQKMACALGYELNESFLRKHVHK